MLPTTTGLIHLAIAGVAAAASCAAMFVIGARFATQTQWRRWATYSHLAGVLTIICVVVYAVWSTQASGLAGTVERLAVLLPGLWGAGVLARLTAGVPLIVRRSDP